MCFDHLLVDAVGLLQHVPQLLHLLRVHQRGPRLPLEVLVVIHAQVLVLPVVVGEGQVGVPGPVPNTGLQFSH